MSFQGARDGADVLPPGGPLVRSQGRGGGGLQYRGQAADVGPRCRFTTAWTIAAAKMPPAIDKSHRTGPLTSVPPATARLITVMVMMRAAVEGPLLFGSEVVDTAADWLVRRRSVNATWESIAAVQLDTPWYYRPFGWTRLSLLQRGGADTGWKHPAAEQRWAHGGRDRRGDRTRPGRGTGTRRRARSAKSGSWPEPTKKKVTT